MERTILHCDCNSFFASVETVLDPSIGTGPMAVCGDPEHRHGIVLAKNEAAKKYNIQTAETVQQALRKCPALRLVPPHHKEYERYSAIVNEIYTRFTDQVEPFGIDESWLDVTGSLHLFGTGVEIADELRRIVREETGLTISVGVSFNKIFAKLGSDYKKPDATTLLSPEHWRELVFPLPVGSLLYVGDAVQATLRSWYIETIGQLAACDERRLRARFGKLGTQLHRYANGLDDDPVRRWDSPREVQSVGNGMTFRRDVRSPEDARVGIMALSEEVAWRLRHQERCGTTVQLQIRDTHMKTISRQCTLENPTALSGEITIAAMELLLGCWDFSQPIRMLTVTVTGLLPTSEASEQLSLFGGNPAERQRQQRLEATLDAVREKYGVAAIGAGSILASDLGVSPLPPKEKET